MIFRIKNTDDSLFVTNKGAFYNLKIRFQSFSSEIRIPQKPSSQPRHSPISHQRWCPSAGNAPPPVMLMPTMTLSVSTAPPTPFLQVMRIPLSFSFLFSFYFIFFSSWDTLRSLNLHSRFWNCSSWSFFYRNMSYNFNSCPLKILWLQFGFLILRTLIFF